MNEIPSAESRGESLKDLLARRNSAPSNRGRWIAAAVVAALAAGWLLVRGGSGHATGYQTEAATRGDLVVRVSATGNLQPTNEVEVGSELSGIVEKVYVDDNDRVKRGELLAELDVAKLRDAIEKSRATLAAAEAQVAQADATVAENRATYERYKEVSRLSDGKVPSRSEMDGAEANLKRAEASAISARANVAQARANLRSDETNLRKASIRSPIDGIVLKRDVEPGQTVAATFQAPVLFKLAEDLRHMELQVDVDEADVGRVREGQRARFTVDAWPGRQYEAVITRVSYGSKETDGVISYLTVLSVDNADLSLRPGMTGTAEITVLHRNGVLLVPNAALRFNPPSAQSDAPKSRGVAGLLMPRPPQPERRAPVNRGDRPHVWVIKDGSPVRVDVETGASDGKLTEITGGDLKAGTEVVTEAAARQP
ncbi:MAG: efflux RND transporter periplasmic adaptor subunit [Steroidobacteraceae bacterium]